MVSKIGYCISCGEFSERLYRFQAIGLCDKCVIKTRNTPVRVRRKRTKGFKLQDSSPNNLPVIYVGRPTRWGNPFVVGIDGNLEEVMIKYRDWLQKKLEDDPNFLEPLRGKNLACWCPLDRPCHVDILYY
jgi:hypothetical protein